jgi:hypothetical protein
MAFPARLISVFARKYLFCLYYHDSPIPLWGRLHNVSRRPEFDFLHVLDTKQEAEEASLTFIIKEKRDAQSAEKDSPRVAPL